MADKNETPMKIIARINNGFTDKFGIPRQSGIANGVKSEIVFEKEFHGKDPSFLYVIPVGSSQ